MVPHLKFFIRKTTEPHEPNTDRQTYDLLSALEPRWYPPGDEEYVAWVAHVSARHERETAHYNCGGFCLDKVGIDSSNETEITCTVEACEDFVRWL